jgi:cob(I)alamin adenosyltransferase
VDLIGRLYTRAGDGGTTGLLGGSRVSKSHARIEALGDVDEANAAIGLALAEQTEGLVVDTLRQAQNVLFTVGAEVATKLPRAKVPRVSKDDVTTLEVAMEGIEVGEIREFVMPRGSPAVASLHFARTVVRRAERRCAALSKKERVNPELLRYLNRLSSFLFQAAVWAQRRERRPEEHPTYRR